MEDDQGNKIAFDPWRTFYDGVDKLMKINQF